MNLKFTFIFFCLILSVISLNLKKKNENKKSLNGIRAFLKTNMGQASDCKYGYLGDWHSKELFDSCKCDWHCKTGHCSFHYWFFGNHYRCTKD